LLALDHRFDGVSRYARFASVHAHRLPFWDAMLWASSACRREAHAERRFQDGFGLQDVTFINPFNPENNQLIDKLLPKS
jgi:hypothetical protein